MSEYTPAVEELAKNTTIRDRRVVALTRDERLRGLAKVQADALREFTDATRMPFVVFRRDDNSPVYVGDLMRETADRIEQEARDGE